MSSNAAAAPLGTLDITLEARRRAALRLAFGVTFCFATVELLELDATFLAPLIAASMLAKPGRPPTFAQGLMVLVLIALSTGLILLVTTALIGNPAVLILALSLIIYLSFYAHKRGAPDLATLLLQISAVALPTIAIVSPAGAAGFATTLFMAGGVALLTVWLAHAILPAPATAIAAPGASTPVQPESVVAGRHALLDTLILFPVLTWYMLDASQVAVVVLIIIITVLRQVDSEKGQRAALGLVLGNLIGGIGAALIYNLVQMSHSFAFFIVACLAASLVFAGRIATAGDRAPIYGIAFSTFILLLGLGLSPLPGGSGQAFADRLTYVLIASAYTVGALALTQRWRLN